MCCKVLYECHIFVPQLTRLHIVLDKMKTKNINQTKINTTMKTTLSILVALMVSFATTVFANNENNVSVSQFRTSPAFYGVVLASDINVVLSQDETPSV